MTTLKEIADLANVSISTVSRILNNDNDFIVKDETRYLVKKIAKEKKYNIKNKSKITKKRNIAFLSGISDSNQISNPYFSKLSNTITGEFKSRNYNIKYFYLSLISIDEIKNDFDFFIVMGHISDNFIKDLIDIKERVIFIGSSPTLVNFDSIKPNFQYAIKQIFNDLLNSNISTVGFIGASSLFKSKKDVYDIYLNERFLIFKAVAQELGMYDAKNVLNGTYDINDAYSLMNELIDRGDLSQAYIIANDQMAVGAMKALIDKNISIPGQVKIYSFDNTEIAKYSPISITSVDLDIEKMVETIFFAMDSRNSGREYPIQFSIANTLIKRESTSIDKNLK